MLGVFDLDGGTGGGLFVVYRRDKALPCRYFFVNLDEHHLN
jgi:hypothetical protein